MIPRNTLSYVGASVLMLLALSVSAGAQVAVLPWLGQDVWYVTEGDGPHDVKFSIVNENNYAVTINSASAWTGSTQGDITDSILFDGFIQSANGVTIPAHSFTTAILEFSPFSGPDEGPPNDGWVDLYYGITTAQGWGANNYVTVYVSDVPEPGTLLTLASGVLGLAATGRRWLEFRGSA